jgi:metal-responsive CopG/Arc/MetJ family transcriptional regulator
VGVDFHMNHDSKYNMKTIAISIDEPTLTALDALARRAAHGGKRRRGSGHRSEIVRQALAEFIVRRETEEREARERTILAHHKKKLARQARALLDEQAEP